MVIARAWLEVQRYKKQDLPAIARAQMLQRWCRAGLRAIDVDVESLTRHEVSQHGLLLSNHLSYLDILVYSSILPCVFVSKAEVERWPFIGRFAEYSGTIFVRRGRVGGDSAYANQKIGESLDSGVPVVLFPEGTTTNGHQVLRFHTSMLQSAIERKQTITPCALRYDLDDGDPALEVCWWGKMLLPPHVLNLLTKRTIRVAVVIGGSFPAEGDRKSLGARARQDVVELYARLTPRSVEVDSSK